ncbi:MAG: hypothetical protein ACQEUZ_06400 [Pseudomonadota bacterium]
MAEHEELLKLAEDLDTTSRETMEMVKSLRDKRQRAEYAGLLAQFAMTHRGLAAILRAAAAERRE